MLAVVEVLAVGYGFVWDMCDVSNFGSRGIMRVYCCVPLAISVMIVATAPSLRKIGLNDSNRNSGAVKCTLYRLPA